MVKGFDRHEILTGHYYHRMKQWKWGEIAREAQRDACQQLEDAEVVADARRCHEDVVGRCYLGTVFALMPSGKYYTCWTTNQSRSDETRDAAAIAALERLAAQHGLFIESGEGDACDLFACAALPVPE